MIVFGCLILASTIIKNVSAGESGYHSADGKNGALLYDNWVKMKNVEEKDMHPLYPVTSKKSGKSTWRCKECHGWDYIGKEGRYAKGSHFTGIEGIYHVKNEDPESLLSSLKDKSKKHDFSIFLTEKELWDLVKFMREGQADIKKVVDELGHSKGDESKGEILFIDNCASCHGVNGDEIDFKDKKDGIQGVGWISNENPQESIHKIRWGHPGSDMPSMLVDKGLSEKDSIDILTYTQSLNSK